MIDIKLQKSFSNLFGFRCWPYFVLGGIIWLANFIHAGSFGIYEDDYIMVLPAIGRSFSELLSANWGYLAGWPQGRPLFWVINDTGCWILYHLGGLNALYLLGFVLQWVVGIAVFQFLLRFFNFTPSFLGAVFFGVFPADTSKQLIMHQALLPLMTLFTLAAINFYRKQKWVACLIVLFLICLTFEPYLLVFVGAGLLFHRNKNKKNFNIFYLTPALMIVLVLFFAFGFRKVLGEARVVSLLSDPWGPLQNALLSLLIGPLNLLLITLSRSGQVLLQADWTERTAWGFVALALAFFLLGNKGARQKMKSKHGKSESWWVLAGALLMTIVPYAYRFIPDYFPPIVNIGRLSSLHQVSALGGSLLLAWFIEKTLKIQSNTKVILVAWIIWITSFLALGLRVQTSQYVRSANLQQKFWMDVACQIGDWKPGFPIIIDFDSGYENGNEWRPGTEGFSPYWLSNYPTKCLTQLFKLPDNWPRQWPEAPSLYIYYPSMPQWLDGEGLAFVPCYILSKDNPLVIYSHRFLLFCWENGRLVRSEKSIFAYNKEFIPQKNNLNKNLFCPELTKTGSDILDRPKKMWGSLIQSRNYP